MTGIHPVTPAQEAVLDESRHAAAQGVNVTQAVVELRGSIDAAAFAAALQGVVGRHAVLRTAFPGVPTESRGSTLLAPPGVPGGADSVGWVPGVGPAPEVHVRATAPLTCEDWRDLPGQDDELERYLEDDRLRGVDLDAPPLLRASLLRRDDEWHDLVLTFHEAVLDGRSLGIVLADLAALRRAAAGGEAPDLPPPPSAAGYARWLREREPSGDEAFWRRLLGGVETLTPAAAVADGPRGAGATPAGGWERRAVSGDLTSLRRLAAREGLELGVLIEAAWALVLATASGRDDVVFGVTGPCRPPSLAGSEAMVGSLASTLPARARISWASPVLAWLRVWAAERLAADAHRHVTPARVRAWADLPGGPLFDSAVACQDPTGGDGWRLRDLRWQPGAPLALQAVVGPDLLLALTHERRLFGRDSAARLLELLRTLLDGIAARPGDRLRDLPLLGARERQRVVVDWNATGSGQPRNACVPELVEARAAEAPGALAVSGGGVRLTYRQLVERAGALTGRLRGLGAGPGTRVGICVERSPELVVGQLAAMKAGAAFVAMDPDSPAARLDLVRRDARLRVLLTQRRLLGRLPAADVPTISLDDPQDPSPPVEVPPAAATPADLAYVIYTSGSTGQPKGVEIEHRALTSRAAWCGCTGGMRPSDRATQVANPSFDISVWEIWSCLVAGASLHVPDQATRTLPARLLAWLRDERITITFLPTPLAELVLAEPWPGGADLRAMFVGGDRLHHVRQEGLPFELYNLYGPTEATIISTSGAVRTGADGDALPPIGRPIADTRAYVLDPHLRPLPAGFAGELCIGGDGLARGYAGRPGLTAAAFVPDRCGDRPGARLYRSGDLVRHAPGGDLEFLGRLDRQVKVRGVRIELAEIEAALVDRPGVAAAAATTIGSGADLAIVAYVVPEPAAVLAGDRLRDALAGTLPAAMVPAAVVLLDELPLTPNGKVDRAALPPPPAQPASYVAPRTPLEAMVARIWSETLGVERIGREDDFFKRGGHSLLAMEVILRTAQATGVEVPLRELFEAPTVAALCALVEERLP